MSDTVKLIIEIPKATYKDLKSGKIYSSLCEAPQGLVEGIRNGTPLDDVLAEIREEIKALDEGITSYEHDDPWIYKREALEIIDKHISGEGDSK